MLKLEQLHKLFPYSRHKVEAYFPFLSAAMNQYEINTKPRIAAFLAQIGHESQGFRYSKEIASGAAYEGRLDLGNAQPGDGKKYKGRGLIQITGRDNYAKCSKALDVDFIEHPTLLEAPEYAAKSAAWFWYSHGLNDLADQNKHLKITKIINGGKAGLFERMKILKKAQEVLTDE